MFWIDLPKETEQLLARRRGGYQGPNRRGFLGEFMRGLDQVANRFFDRVEELGFATTPKA
jgi:hypothetical protein